MEEFAGRWGGGGRKRLSELFAILEAGSLNRQVYTTRT